MPLEFDAEDRKQIQEILARYPRSAAALLPVLHLAQDKFGHLSPDVQLLVAGILDVPPTRVREVVTFYEMFHEHPEGQFHLELCTNIACHLAGADRLLEHVEGRLGVKCGHHTEDGTFSLMQAECLASCGSGPAMRVGWDYYEYLDEASIDGLLERLKRAAPTLNGRGYRHGPDGPHTGPVPGFTPRLPVVHAAPAPKSGAPASAPVAQAPVSAPAAQAPASAPAAQAAPAAAPTDGAAPVVVSDKGASLPSFDPPPLDKRPKAEAAAAAPDKAGGK